MQPIFLANPLVAYFHTFPKFPPRNGVQNGVQEWDPKMGSNMESENAVREWGPKNGVQHEVQKGIQKWGPKVESKLGALVLGASPIGKLFSPIENSFGVFSNRE